MPFPLPPDPPLDLSGNRQRLLERATLALGRLGSVSTLLPDPQLFLYAYVRREAVFSSQIEGTQSSFLQRRHPPLNSLKMRVAERTGLEPVTSAVTGQRSNH